MLVSREPGAFPPIQVELVHSLASHLGAALGAAFLHGRLQSAVAELEETRERLERSERMRVAGEMASGVAHDFNNVLGAILGRAQLVRRRAQSGQLAGEELDRALEIIERAAQDGGDTVRRLRQFGSGGRESGSEVVDLDVAIRDAAEYTRPRWENEAQAVGRQIRVEIDSRPGATIEGRASELREVFTNLILNSMDALPAGGTIRLATEVTPDRVTARIEDDGVGMSADVQRRIFDPFFTTKGDGGTGLGLSIVYGIVQAASGTIAVDSAPGRGSRMTLGFPHAAPGIAEARPQPRQPHASAALRVMVVDDEPAVRDLLIDILRSLGHSPQGFDSGTAAFDAYSTGTYDLVFTDLGMPGMTGWDLARAIRRRDSQVPIALITGWGAEVGPEALESAGADAVVTKPFTIEDIEVLCRLARDRGRRAA
jgi:signal transduction histidine kinase/ActR/RegA family two-component response regulator